MKRIFYAFVLVCIAASCAWSDVAINALNFPDNAFREYVRQFDQDGDGILSYNEISSVADIDVSSMDISSLEGIKNFTGLVNLKCDFNKLETLDVGNLTSLRELSASHNNIAELSFSGCRQIQKINMGYNMLRGFRADYYNSLTEVILNNNRLKYVTMNGCGNLQKENSDHNEMEGGYVYNNLTKLSEVSCVDNKLTVLTFNNCPSLRKLNCNGNIITELNLSRNTQLEELNCQNNSLAFIELSTNTLLSTDTLKINPQKIRNAKIVYEPQNNLYPYKLDFKDYKLQNNHLITSSIQGRDQYNNEIAMNYMDGVAYFAKLPAKVNYKYDTGFNNIYMEAVMTSDGTSYEIAALNNHVYRTFPLKKTWQEAKEYCESFGGHLATITTPEEEALIENMLLEAHLIDSNDERIENFWLGAEKSSGSWRWITGETSETDEEFFADIENGIYLQISLSEGVSSSESSDTGGFICEWEPIEVEVAPLSEQFLLFSADPEGYYDGLEFYGKIPEVEDFSHLSNNLPEISDITGTFFASEVLPPRYDLRDDSRITSVKDQGDYGTCWAHAALGSLESSYLTQNSSSSQPDASELHLAWFTYNDLRPGYSFPMLANVDTLNQGGYATKVIALLSRLAGPALESDLPYSSANNVSNLKLEKLPENYTRPFRLKEAYILGEITNKNRDIVKRVIMKHGAVSISYVHDSNSFNTVTSAYYIPENKTNHEVNIIGWDDNYPRTNFTLHPSVNGAWLARNSWGEDWGDEGYFWISYEQNIPDATLFIAGDNYSGLKEYGYDALGGTDKIKYQWAANIFRAKDDEILREVGFYTKDNNALYEIYINTFDNNRPVNPGTLDRTVASGKMKFAGYHVIELPEDIVLSRDQYFAVIVKVRRASDYEYITAIEGFGGTSVVNEGESYFSSADYPGASDWADGKTITTRNSAGSNACIKAFTVPNIPITINANGLPSGKVGQRYTYTFTASGTGPITWTITNLPDFLTLNDATISGTPSNAGRYRFLVSAANSNGSVSETFELEIEAQSTDEEEPEPNPLPALVGGSSGGGCSAGSCFAGIILVTFMFKRRKQ